MNNQFQKLVEIAAANYSFSKSFKAIQICQEYRNVVKAIFSPDAAEKTFPLSYQNNIFTVGVVNSAWSQKVMMNQHLIIQKLNGRFGAKTVSKIKIKLQKFDKN